MTINGDVFPADTLDTDPRIYLASVCTVTLDIVAELAEAIDNDDQHVMRAACLRLTSIGALAGIAAAKL